MNYRSTEVIMATANRTISGRLIHLNYNTQKILKKIHTFKLPLTKYFPKIK